MGTERIDTIVALLRATRDGERDVFGSLDPVARDRPMRPGDWSPKDHQAHLTAWKARQANRFAAARRGDEPGESSGEDETDAVNAELQAARAGWSWDAIVEEADEVSERMIRELVAIEPEALARWPRLIEGMFGNGPFHVQTHFGWIDEANVGLDSARVAAFVAEVGSIVERGELSDRDAGTTAYNIACYHALGGRLDEARRLLPRAFELRPDLAEFSRDDPDLTALRGELEELAARSA